MESGGGRYWFTSVKRRYFGETRKVKEQMCEVIKRGNLIESEVMKD